MARLEPLPTPSANPVEAIPIVPMVATGCDVGPIPCLGAENDYLEVDMTDTAAHAVDYLLDHCGALQKGETALVVCDPQTAEVGALFLERGRRAGHDIALARIPGFTAHGQEPPAEIARAMAEADLVLGLTALSMAHTQARLTACQRGARYLSLPEFSLGLLADPAVLADFRGRREIVQRVADAFTQGEKVRVACPLGTDMEMTISGRVGNACPGCVEAPGALGSPPDIEANVSPVEHLSQGKVVVNGSIPCPEIGLLESPLTLYVEQGRIVRFEGDPDLVKILDGPDGLFPRAGSDKAYVLAECGVGLNDLARLTGVMLTDEGALGRLHFGFGSNNTVGGRNAVSFHLDFVFGPATLTVDGRTILTDRTLFP